jgi:predicted ATPase
MGIPPSIYIIGAQCTGKTTLVEDLRSHIVQHQVGLHSRLHTITEVARSVLRDHDFTREDLAKPDRAMKLQRLILDAQLKAENHTEGTILSDRSGLDPLVYAAKCGPPGGLASIMASPTWETLKGRMRRSLVILCPPRADWLYDDGIRLMAEDWDDWEDTHRVFQKLLGDCHIRYHLIPDSISSPSDRVKFVLTLWHQMTSPLRPPLSQQNPR